MKKTQEKAKEKEEQLKATRRSTRNSAQDDLEALYAPPSKGPEKLKVPRKQVAVALGKNVPKKKKSVTSKNKMKDAEDEENQEEEDVEMALAHETSLNKSGNQDDDDDDSSKSNEQEESQEEELEEKEEGGNDDQVMADATSTVVVEKTQKQKSVKKEIQQRTEERKKKEQEKKKKDEAERAKHEAESKKHEEQEKEYREFKALRGQMVIPSKLPITVELINHYKQICKGKEPGLKAIYTYNDPKRSVGIVFSYLVKVGRQNEVREEGMTLELFVYICNVPQIYLARIPQYVKRNEQPEYAAKLADVQGKFPDVQNEADAQVDLKKLQLEIRFLNEWLADEMNFQELLALRKKLGLSQMIKVKVEEDALMRSPEVKRNTQGQRKQLAKHEESGKKLMAKYQDEPMAELPQEDDGDESDMSCLSFTSHQSYYATRVFSAVNYSKLVLRTNIMSETLFRMNAVKFWTKSGLVGGDGYLKLFGIQASQMGRILLGIEEVRFCVCPGQILVQEVTLKEPNPAKQKEVKIANIKMNYYGFNAFALIDMKDNLVELEKQKKKEHDKLVEIRKEYFRGGGGEKTINVQHPLIQFNRLEFAIDLAAFINSPKTLSADLTAEQRKKETDKLKKQGYPAQWNRAPAVTNQFVSMALMYNFLYDHNFFFNKLLMFQVMCCMTQKEPAQFINTMKTERDQFDLSDYFAFDNDWNYYSFQRMFHVDVYGRDPEVKKKREQDKKDKKAQGVVKGKDTKQFNKAQKAEEEKKLNAKKTEAQRAQDQADILKKIEEDANRRKQYNSRFNPHTMTKKQLQEFKNEDTIPDVLPRVEPSPIVKKEKKKQIAPFSEVDKDWHVFDFIQKQYQNKEYGPFIVQMQRKDKKQWMTEYAVVKHLDGVDDFCVVLNAGGPHFCKLSEFHKATFPLDALYYYYTSDSIPTKEQQYTDDHLRAVGSKIHERRSQIKNFYRVCSIFKLEQVDKNVVKMNDKYRFVSELIYELGRSKLGDKQFFVNTLQTLKNPTNLEDYNNKGPQYAFKDNQHIIDRIFEGQQAQEEYPEVAHQAQLMLPVRNLGYGQAGIYIENSNECSEEMLVLKQQAMIVSILQQCCLADTNGGIDIRQGGFNGLLQLKYTAEKMHQNAMRTLSIAKAETRMELGRGADQSIKRHVVVNMENGYAVERQVAFFLHTIATGLVAFMAKAMANKRKMYTWQRYLADQVLADNPGCLDLNQLLQRMVTKYTSLREKNKIKELFQKVDVSQRDRLIKYYEQLTDPNNHESPETLVVNEAFKISIAQVYMVSRKGKEEDKKKVGKSNKKNKRKLKKNKKKEKDDDDNDNQKVKDQLLELTRKFAEESICKFSIAQVMNSLGLRLLFDKIMEQYNLRYLGAMRQDLNAAIQQLSKFELEEMINARNIQNGVQCYTFDRDGNLFVLVGSDEPLIKLYNTHTKIAHWRILGWAAIEVASFNGFAPPQKLAADELEEHQYFKSEIWQKPNLAKAKDGNNKSGISSTTKGSTGTKTEGAEELGEEGEIREERLISGKEEDQLNRTRKKHKGEDSSDNEDNTLYYEVKNVRISRHDTQQYAEDDYEEMPHQNTKRADDEFNRFYDHYVSSSNPSPSQVKKSESFNIPSSKSYYEPDEDEIEPQRDSGRRNVGQSGLFMGGKSRTPSPTAEERDRKKFMYGGGNFRFAGRQQFQMGNQSENRQYMNHHRADARPTQQIGNENPFGKMKKEDSDNRPRFPLPKKDEQMGPGGRK